MFFFHLLIKFQLEILGDKDIMGTKYRYSVRIKPFRGSSYSDGWTLDVIGSLGEFLHPGLRTSDFQQTLIVFGGVVDYAEKNIKLNSTYSTQIIHFVNNVSLRLSNSHSGRYL